MASTTETVVPNADGKYACPHCDELFDSRQALGGHATKHARQQRAQVQTFSLKAQITEQMREVLAPMQAQLDELNAGIATKMRELVEMREARTMIEGVMKKLDPTAATAKAKANGDGRGSGAAFVATREFERKTQKLREVIEQHPELFVDGLTANALGDHWREQGWQPATSLQTIRKGFELLRDQGIVRADRVTKGGGMSWKLVSNDNGNGGNDDAT
jgi:uncharacterized Zn finger protein (UPF0148 family)